MTIAVLALQGAFVEHELMLEKLGVDYVEIRKKEDWNNSYDGLILPGGESTVIGKLLVELDLMETIREWIAQGGPVFGTCAGLILLANQVGSGEKTYIKTLPITVKRNAYGRQLGSFQVEARCEKIGKIPMVFIRAPYIEKVDLPVKILAKVEDKIVAARYNNQLVTAFHPELTNDLSVHQYFIKMVKEYAREK